VVTVLRDGVADMETVAHFTQPAFRCCSRRVA
jgi:hypothetical protein